MVKAEADLKAKQEVAAKEKADADAAISKLQEVPPPVPVRSPGEDRRELLRDIDVAQTGLDVALCETVTEGTPEPASAFQGAREASSVCEETQRHLLEMEKEEAASLPEGGSPVAAQAPPPVAAELPTEPAEDPSSFPADSLLTTETAASASKAKESTVPSGPVEENGMLSGDWRRPTRSDLSFDDGGREDAMSPPGSPRSFASISDAAGNDETAFEQQLREHCRQVCVGGGEGRETEREGTNHPITPPSRHGLPTPLVELISPSVLPHPCFFAALFPSVPCVALSLSLSGRG